MVDILTSLVIHLDFIPIVFFVFLYSFLEILIRKLMDDFRSLQFQQHHLEHQQQEDEDLIGARIVFPVHLNFIDRSEQSHDDVSEDYDDGDDDYDDDELIPVPIEDFDDDDDDDFEDDDDFDFDDDYDDDDDDFAGDFDEEEEENDDGMTSPSRVSNSVTANECGDGTLVKQETSSSNNGNSNVNGNGDQIEGLICPICFEPWTSSGPHQICCLPCGHLYGLSCIKKWLNQRRSSGKCPQCNSLCTFKDVRVLYVNRLCVADEELQKRVRSLETKCAYLEQKVVPLTPDEMIDQICSNPTLLQRLATMLNELHQPQVSP